MYLHFSTHTRMRARACNKALDVHLSVVIGTGEKYYNRYGDESYGENITFQTLHKWNALGFTLK